MAKKEYTGLKAEFVSFGENDLNTLDIPEGLSGCRLGTIEVYVTPLNPSDKLHGPGYCYDDDENEYIFNWASIKNR